jgi:Ni/Co efflux regulator RcnB
MKRIQGYGLLVFALAAIWATAAIAGAQTQGKRQDKGKSEKDGKKNEQMVEREKDRHDASSKAYEEKTSRRGSKAAKAKKAKYKPRGMTDKDMMDWTDGNPPGWSHGEKSGWGGAGAPPGQMKGHEQEILFYPRGSEGWGAGKKEDWHNKFEQSRVRILERIRARDGMTREDEESANVSLGWAAREGVPPEHIEATMNRAIARGMRGREMEKVTRAMSYGVDRGADYDKLDRFIEKKMNEGERGEELALSIYREIAEQHAAKAAAPAKKPWSKRLFGG